MRKKKQMLVRKWKMKTGDKVVVVAGSHKGKEGEILKVDRLKERIVVKGVALITRHQKPSQANPEGGRVRRESSLHVSNVMHIDPESAKPTRAGVRVSKEGERLLYAKKSGKEVRAL